MSVVASDFSKSSAERPTIKKKHGRQSVMITKEFSLFSVDPQTAMIDLGTSKHPVGSVWINVHLDYEVPVSIYISVHGGKW